MTRYRWVAARKAEGFPTTAACQVAKVSRQAFYGWRGRQAAGPSPAQLADAELVAERNQLCSASASCLFQIIRSSPSSIPALLAGDCYHSKSRPRSQYLSRTGRPQEPRPVVPVRPAGSARASPIPSKPEVSRRTSGGNPRLVAPTLPPRLFYRRAASASTLPTTGDNSPAPRSAAASWV